MVSIAPSSFERMPELAKHDRDISLKLLETVMQTLDLVSGLHNCLEFSQPLSCLYQAMQTRKTFSTSLEE